MVGVERVDLDLDFGFWILDFGFWILDFGFWILDFGFWILDFGFWILGLDCMRTRLSCSLMISSVVGANC